MGKRLYVGNLSYQTADADLQELFAGAGAVRSAQVVQDRDTGRSKGFGFVEMENEGDAMKAITQFDGFMLHQRQIKVNEARPRPERTVSSGGFGGGSRGGRGRGGRW